VSAPGFLAGNPNKDLSARALEALLQTCKVPQNSTGYDLFDDFGSTDGLHRLTASYTKAEASGSQPEFLSALHAHHLTADAAVVPITWQGLSRHRQKTVQSLNRIHDFTVVQTAGPLRVLRKAGPFQPLQRETREHEVAE